MFVHAQQQQGFAIPQVDHECAPVRRLTDQLLGTVRLHILGRHPLLQPKYNYTPSSPSRILTEEASV